MLDVRRVLQASDRVNRREPVLANPAFEPPSHRPNVLHSIAQQRRCRHDDVSSREQVLDHLDMCLDAAAGCERARDTPRWCTSF